MSNVPKYRIYKIFSCSGKGIFKIPKPSGEKTRKDLVIIGKVLFSSNLLFSKDYILLLKITLKLLFITQGKYVPLLIHLLAMQQSWEVLRSIRDILFEKVCENIAKNDYLGHLDHGSFWQLFFSDVDSAVSYSEVWHSNLSRVYFSRDYIFCRGDRYVLAYICAKNLNFCDRSEMPGCR